MMSSAEAVKKIRFQMFMEQQKFANQLGVSKQTISNWESGRGKPKLSKIKELLELCKNNNIEAPAIESFME